MNIVTQVDASKVKILSIIRYSFIFTGLVAHDLA